MTTYARFSRMIRLHVPLLIYLMLGGCMWWGDAPPQMPNQRDVDGITIAWGNNAPTWVLDDEPILNIIDRAAEFAGGTRNDIRGWTIVFRDQDVEHVECSTTDTESHTYSGCAWIWAGWIDLSTYRRSNAERTSLLHEIIHAIIGDTCHRSEIWGRLQDIGGIDYEPTC